MNQDKGVPRPVGDQGCGDNRFAECGSRRQDGNVMQRQRIEGFDLLTSQLSFKSYI